MAPQGAAIDTSGFRQKLARPRMYRRAVVEMKSPTIFDAEWSTGSSLGS
jgi:hypothetical protein